MRRIAVPDIGDFKDVAVIEVSIAAGGTVTKDQTVAVLESDKATVEIPSPEGGVVASVEIKVGDKVSAGSPLMVLRTAETTPAETDQQVVALARSEGYAEPIFPSVPAPQEPSAGNIVPLAAATARLPRSLSSGRVYAGPALRKFARELGVDLREVKGTGPRGRIVTKDVSGYVKSVIPERHAIGGAASVPPPGSPSFALPAWPQVDHAKFGKVDQQPLSRIRKISAANLHRNWVMIPHVTNHDDADVTDLEAFRSELNREQEKTGVRLSPLAFIMKASVAALQAFPEFNASLDGDTLILKRYYHIGFAADTPNGLVVPVIRDANQKGIGQLATEMAELAAKARVGKLAAADMQGGSFSISSLGGIGGSYFTPIINAPEVAILGVGKIQTRVVWLDGQPQPRLCLPLSLSWDHRVVDGAAAGRFNAFLVRALSDLRRLLV